MNRIGSSGASTGPEAPGQGPAFRGRHPAALAFGTSGLRGLVSDITDLEAYINTRGFLDYLRQSGLPPGEIICMAGDLRPSTDGPDRSILRAVARGITDSGFQVDNLGRLPTPALTCYALKRKRASVMVTGSHIPFDRNGIKFNKPEGEVLKADEPGILEAVERVRAAEYSRPAAQSLMDDSGMFKMGQQPALPPPNPQAQREYIQRYLDFLPRDALKGTRLVLYQHSAVGRDLLLELLTGLGAQVIPAARSEIFVPIDTEAVSEEKLALLQQLTDHARQSQGPVDAIVSTDGDSDRPLLAGVDAEGQVRFVSGDVLGILAAEFLDADAAVVPISVNDAVDRWAAGRDVRLLKTRIGSPYVIEGMQQAQAGGAARVVGWEANGGFLTGTDIERKNRRLAALPTRDAALPILAALCSAREKGIPLVERCALLPRRYSKAGLIDNFPLDTSRALLRHFTPGEDRVREAEFAGGKILVQIDGVDFRPAKPNIEGHLDMIRRVLERFFNPRDGFDRVVRINWLDGVRVYFANGDIAHIRPSGNAPQLRIYAVADTQARADAIVFSAVSGPDPILRRMETSAS